MNTVEYRVTVQHPNREGYYYPKSLEEAATMRAMAKTYEQDSWVETRTVSPWVPVVK